MNTLTTQQRLAQLRRECPARTYPALLLLASCAVFVVVLAASAVRGESAPAQARTPGLQSLPPAA